MRPTVKDLLRARMREKFVARQHASGKPADAEPCSCAICLRQNPPESVKEYRKSITHWFYDGSVILLLDSTAFCLHKSRLEQQSQFLKNHFRTSSPVGFDEEKRPMFELTDVDVYAFELLLDMMDDGL